MIIIIIFIIIIIIIIIINIIIIIITIIISCLWKSCNIITHIIQCYLTDTLEIIWLHDFASGIDCWCVAKELSAWLAQISFNS